MLLTGCWLGGQCDPWGHVEVRHGEDRAGQSCPSCNPAAHCPVIQTLLRAGNTTMVLLLNTGLPAVGCIKF